jgi:tRNA-Thr(GGU) m(6)t(6)A37 methyltransferase TsaA
MKDHFEVYPVGVVRKRGEAATIEIHAPYTDALLGLDQFSHVVVLTWFHKNDTPERRRTLRVHPRGNPNNPLTGVFGTRSPARPNLIGMHVCEILSLKGKRVRVKEIDAFDGTPVLDLKPCLSQKGMAAEVRVPEWVKKDH